MYIVTKFGTKLPVDDSAIDYENEYVPGISQVTMLDEGVTLKERWLVTIQRDTHFDSSPADDKNERFEFVAEKLFDHEPTKEEILYFMSSWGCGIGAIANMEKVFLCDWESDD